MTLLGFSLAFLSAFLHAAWNVVARKVSGSPGVILLALWAASAAALPFLFLLADRGDLAPLNLAYAIGTGVMMSVYIALLGEAYGVRELSYVYPISRGVGLVGTVVAGMMLFGESLSGGGVAGLILLTLGTVVIGWEGGASRTYRGLWLAVLPGLALVATYLVGKGIAHRMSPFGYCFVMYLASAVVSTPFTFSRHRASLREAWHRHKVASAFIGIASFASYAVLMLAFRTDNAGYLVAVRELSVAMAALGGYRFLGERIDGRRAVGIAAIVVGAMVMKFI